MSQITRCKFYCASVAATANGPTDKVPTPPVEQEEITLLPVYGDANKPWSKFTPMGQMRFTVTNPDVIGKFVPGKAYYIDIAEAS